MKHLILTRKNQVVSEDGSFYQTLGELSVHENGKQLFKCYTLERPWRKNFSKISCIPPAPGGKKVYKWVERNTSPTFDYAHIHIHDVPDRTWILIHRGNYMEDGVGCVLVGLGKAYLNKDQYLDLTKSREAMKGLMSALGGQKSGDITVYWWVEALEPVRAQDVADEFLQVRPPEIQGSD